MSSVNRSRETETVSLNEHIFVSAPAQQRGRANANNKNSIVTAALFSSHSHTRAVVPGPGRGFIACFCTTLIISTINQIILLPWPPPWPLPWPARPGSGWPPQPQVRGASVGILLSWEYFPRPGHQQRRQIASHLIFVFARVSSG